MVLNSKECRASWPALYIIHTYDINDCVVHINNANSGGTKVGWISKEINLEEDSLANFKFVHKCKYTIMCWVKISIQAALCKLIVQ